MNTKTVAKLISTCILLKPQISISQSLNFTPQLLLETGTVILHFQLQIGVNHKRKYTNTCYKDYCRKYWPPL